MSLLRKVKIKTQTGSADVTETRKKKNKKERRQKKGGGPAHSVSSALITAHTSRWATHMGVRGPRAGTAKNDPNRVFTDGGWECRVRTQKAILSKWCPKYSRGAVLLSQQGWRSVISHPSLPLFYYSSRWQPGWSLDGAPFFSCSARHRLRKTTAATPHFSRCDNFEKIF